MRVLLKDVLDCHPDAAWRAIRSPAVFREVSSPLFTMESMNASGFPTIWEPGEHQVSLRGLGLVPLGSQIIKLNVEVVNSTDPQLGDVRILRDTGRPVSGPLASVSLWDHRMAISAAPGNPEKTLYRDQLKFGAGAITVPMWPAFWSFWQWRMHQLKRLAPSWRFDVGVDAPQEPEPGPGQEQGQGQGPGPGPVGPEPVQ